MIPGLCKKYELPFVYTESVVGYRAIFLIRSAQESSSQADVQVVIYIQVSTSKDTCTVYSVWNL